MSHTHRITAVAMHNLCSWCFLWMTISRLCYSVNPVADPRVSTRCTPPTLTFPLSFRIDIVECNNRYEWIMKLSSELVFSASSHFHQFWISHWHPCIYECNPTFQYHLVLEKQHVFKVVVLLSWWHDNISCVINCKQKSRHLSSTFWPGHPIRVASTPGTSCNVEVKCT